MKKKIAERWVKALRSGKYKQGKSALCSVIADTENPKEKTKSYCCLGVLADLASKSTSSDKPGEWVRLAPMKQHFGNTKINADGKLEQPASFRDKDHKPAATGDVLKNRQLDPKTRNEALLTVGLQKWSGIKTDCGWLNGTTSCEGGSLVALNDTGATFEQLAGIIEQGYAKL